ATTTTASTTTTNTNTRAITTITTTTHTSQTWTLFKETAPRFKHPFGTITTSTYYCYTELLTTQ
ncbi:MAG: hypothetical protein ACKPKO_22600, partial [Candidatus Fonsibacter sp.]